MRPFLYILFVFGAFAMSANPSGCVTGTLQSYMALGSGGCTIGQNTYLNFQSLMLTDGNAQIVPSQVSITPSAGTSNPTLTISVSQTANYPADDEVILNYSVTGRIYTGELLTLSDSSEAGNGDVSDFVNYCENGPFGPDGVTGCAGTTGGTVLVDGLLNSDMFSFALPHFVSLTDDLILDGGFVAGDSATGATISDQLTSVPELDSYLMVVLAFALVFTLKSRLSRRG